MTKVLVVAGETSGDLHGAGLVSALLRKSPGLEVYGAGGRRMGRAGMDVLVDLTPHAAVGAVEAFKGLRKLWGSLEMLKRVLRERRPDALVLIDFPEFNMRLGRVAKAMGIPVVYYIGPQVWAWRSWRVRQIAEMVDKMLVIFDFEEELYRRVGVDVTFLGHPLLDVVDDSAPEPGFREGLGLSREDVLVGMLPGSREKEMERLLPIMLKAAERVRALEPTVKFAVSRASGVSYEAVRRLCEGSLVKPLVVSDTYELLKNSKVAMVASGTATLEAAILRVPMVVIYRVAFITWCLFIRLMNVSDYALVNIVAGKRVVPELMQWEAQPEMVANEAMRLLTDEAQERVKGELARVKGRLGKPGAAERAAEEVLSLVERKRILKNTQRRSS